MNDKIAGWGGGAVVALGVVGVTAFAGAMMSFVTVNFAAAGICLLASAVAFGGIANVVFRR